MGWAALVMVAAALLAPGIPAALVPPTLGALGGIGLLGLGLTHYGRAGPSLAREELHAHRATLLLALLRLAGWNALLLWSMASLGSLLLTGAAPLFAAPPGVLAHVVAGVLAIAAMSGFRFLHCLLYKPGLIVASFSYRPERLYRLWGLLTPGRLRALACAGLLLGLGLIAPGLWRTPSSPSLLGLALAAALLGRLPLRPGVARPAPAAEGPLNLLMIGCDTLRADRVFEHPALTPHLHALRARASAFTQCHTPCARTAPSLMSLFTGCWPQRHGLRDNFPTSDALPADLPALPALLGAAGYQTVAISDWCGADFGKFDFGFQTCDLPPDQWNLRYLMRQGPKPLRLLLALFADGEWGRRWLPEIHFLGGVPSTTRLSQRAEARLDALAADEQPFLLNVFFSTTHPPFAPEYPWYLHGSDPAYAGPSKFALAGVSDPGEILRRQAESKEAFDLAQILALYDGCVAQFDHAVGALLASLERRGLAARTLVVVYADHGTDFFEQGSWGQGNSVLGETSSRIPLLIADPRAAAPRQIDAAVRAIDLAPTLLDLLGLPPAPAMDGCSLRPWLDDAPQPSLPVYTETGLWLTTLPGQRETHLRYPAITELLEVATKGAPALRVKPCWRAAVIAAKDRALTDDGWKLVWQPLQDGVQLSLFDLRRDPECREDRLREAPARAAALLAGLAEFLNMDGLTVPPGLLRAHAP